jgi:hypothetical protein
VPDGAYEFQVRATDADDNTDPTPAVKSFTVDTRAPETRIDSGPAAVIATTGPQFAFSASEPSSFECRLDGQPFGACSSPLTVTAAEGSHVFAVRATDAAGHTDSSAATQAFSVDSVAPNTRLTKTPKATIKSRRRPTLRFEFSADEPGVAFQCRIDRGPFARCDSPRKLRRVGFGSHRFEVRAVDGVLNLEPEAARYSFEVERKHRRR